MSSYGRAYDAAVAVLEGFGIDPQMTDPKWYTRNDDGEKQLITLAEAVTSGVYDSAYAMGERVAIKRMQRHIEIIMQTPDEADQP